jgi:hypothetical protein
VKPFVDLTHDGETLNRVTDVAQRKLEADEQAARRALADVKSSRQ